MKNWVVVLLLAHFITSTCPGGDTLCSRCGGDHCLFCMASYKTSSGLCLLVETPNQKNQCLSYENARGDCMLCNYGYYVNENKGCSPIDTITRCLVYDPDTESCIVCNGGILPDEEGKCIEGESCSIENCLVCRNLNGVEECLHCTNNFTAVTLASGENTCVFQNSHTLNCRQAEFNNPRKCMECNINYYYSFGECLRSDAVNIGINFAGKESVTIMFAGIAAFIGLLVVN